MAINKKKTAPKEKRYYRKQVNGIRFCAPSPEMLDEKIRKYFEKLENQNDEHRELMTVADYIIEWHESTKCNIATSTFNTYSYAAKHIIARIGSVQICNVTPAILENCVKDFAYTKLKDRKNYPSQKYIDSLITVLKLVFKKAKKELLLPYNYAEDISVKSISTKEGTKHRALTEEEICRVLNFQHTMRPYCLFMMLCGLMPEETVPLNWGDIKYNKQTGQYTVTVSKTAELVSGWPVRIRDGKTKTEFRKRTIPIPEPLSEWIKDNQRKHRKNELIFKNRYGKLLSPSALRKRWKSYLLDMDIYYNNKPSKYNPTVSKKDKKLSIEEFKPYDLRHTYATLLASIDTPIRKTTALMGHSESSTTDKYYIDMDKLNTSGDVKNLSQELSRISNSTTEYTPDEP